MIATKECYGARIFFNSVLEIYSKEIEYHLDGLNSYFANMCQPIVS